MIGFDLFKTCAPANCNIEPKNEKEQITAQQQNNKFKLEVI